LKAIRVLVVDDSFFMRKLISDILQGSGMIEVVDTAKNGLEAVEKTQILLPDVVTLDVEMPKLNGLEALQKIMSSAPLPVIMLSSLTKQGADTTIRALEYGAFDFVAKPSGSISLNIKEIKSELIDKILLAHKQSEKWLKQWKENDAGIGDTAPSRPKETANFKKIIKYPEQTSNELLGLVAIGTSTGGPKALQEVITKIPNNFPYGIVIVQHMPAGFTKSLADRLNSLAAINVVEAEDGMIINPNTAYIAPGNFHMTVLSERQQFRIKLLQTEAVSGHRPAVDIMFQSLKDLELDKIYVIMTGMGSDGTKGLLAAKNKKRDFVIAEDEKTCVVYGMPKTAFLSGTVDRVVALQQISEEIVYQVQKQRGWQSWN